MTNTQMFSSILTTIGSILLISGCAATPVTTGKNVFLVPSNASHLSNCKLLGQISLNVDVTDLAYNEQRKEIKYRLRDATANKYPNADTVAYSDAEINNIAQGKYWITVKKEAEAMATVFKCFNR